MKTVENHWREVRIYLFVVIWVKWPFNILVLISSGWLVVLVVLPTSFDKNLAACDSLSSSIQTWMGQNGYWAMTICSQLWQSSCFHSSYIICLPAKSTQNLHRCCFPLYPHPLLAASVLRFECLWALTPVTVRYLWQTDPLGLTNRDFFSHCFPSSQQTPHSGNIKLFYSPCQIHVARKAAYTLLGVALFFTPSGFEYDQEDSAATFKDIQWITSLY